MKKGFCAMVILTMALAGTVAAQQTQPQQKPPQQQQPQAPAPGQAQPAAQPGGPKTVEERDAFVAFRDEMDPTKQLELGQQFLSKFPDSALKSFTYAIMASASLQKNDADHALEYGEKSIQEDPNSMAALGMVAMVLSRRTTDKDLDRDQRLGRAEQYAKRAIQLISALPQPPGTTEQEWTTRRRAIEASPHASLGVVYLKRHLYKDAISELKTATEMNTLQPDPIDFFLLGHAYDVTKDYDSAIQAFQRSVELGGVTKDQAQAEIDRLQKTRAQAPAAPPAEKKEEKK